jgi:hypothetical protein
VRELTSKPTGEGSISERMMPRGSSSTGCRDVGKVSLTTLSKVAGDEALYPQIGVSLRALVKAAADADGSLLALVKGRR